MATTFEEYIQLELPKRPFLENDVPVESIIVRRGSGPRQLDGIELNDGDIITKRDGQLVAESLDSNVSAIDSIVHTVITPAVKWTINHTKTNRNVVITLLDSSHNEIMADSVKIADNSIEIEFTIAQSGIANIIFLPS